MLRIRGLWVVAALFGGLLAASISVRAQDEDAIGFERTPPRLSFTDGEVSFWRPGGEDWTPARVNTALAAGDELYAAAGSNLELQVGDRAFVRAGEETQFGLTNLEPDFLQLRLTTGYISLDLRSRKASQTIEIDTPNAAFTVEHTGYYRVQVDGATTTFISRRGGRATVTAANGASGAIAPSEQVVVSGMEAPQIETYSAPELDAWDRWNYTRSDLQIDSVSARYVSSGVYGVDDLDHYGDWRVVPRYGAVWVPRGVPVGWAPYSTGRWIYDPYYSWTWVDDEPWGWAPYHYGRWTYVSGFWGWCPGPIVVRPYYAPALVAFFGHGGSSIGISLGRPYLGWVALGWGEPLVPWWGSVGFRTTPHWVGWRGPRIVNEVVVKHRTVIKVREINVYQNARVRDAIVAVDRDHFGRRSVTDDRRAPADPEKFELLRGELPVKVDHASFVAATGPAKRPPRDALQRSVVATREPWATPVVEPETRRPQTQREEGKPGTPRPESALPQVTPPTRVVEPQGKGRGTPPSARPPFGRQSEAERRPPAPPPRFRDVEQGEKQENRAGLPLERETKRGETSLAPAAPRATAEPMPRVERPQSIPQKRNEVIEATRPAPPPQEPRSESRSPAPALPQSGVQRERVGRAQPEAKVVPRRDEQASPRPRDLPGEPASRVYRNRAEPRSRQVERDSAASENRKDGRRQD